MNPDNEREQVPLPEGWRVEEADMVGVTYFDADDRPRVQHPSDTPAGRRLAWLVASRREVR